MTPHLAHPAVRADRVDRARRAQPAGVLGGGLLFLVTYLLVSPISGMLADRPLPLPDDPAGDIVAYLGANPAAVIATAVLQVVSVAGLLVFSRASRLTRRTSMLAAVAVTAMVVSSVVAVIGAITVGEVSPSAVLDLRRVSFYTGGVIHVVALGLFVWAALVDLVATRSVGRGVRIFGRVAAVLAVLSSASILIYYANALLPLGRVACMAWIVAVGVTTWRRRR